jgi:DNA polymerase elongation subunit (family B)
MSYRNVYYDGRRGCVVLWTWDSEGHRVRLENSFEPYLYIESGAVKDAVSIFNTNLKKLTFKNAFERNKFATETSIVRLFHNISCEQQYLLDTFKGEVDKTEFASNPLKIWYIDIEVYSKDEFPTAEEAKYPINLITIYDSLEDRYYTWGAKKYTPKKEKSVYFYFPSEKAMILDFISFMQKDYPDIITGWNIEGYDIPYIINRIVNLFDEEKARDLSPVGQLYYRDGIERFGKITGRWHIRGISCIDYLEAYKIFSPGEKESYSLNYISELELKEGKLAINATNLATLSETDWENFVDYNIQDVDLVRRLEAAKGILRLIRILAYKGLTHFESALGKVAIVTGAVALQAAKQGFIIPTFKNEKIKEDYDGGFVRDPDRGLKKAIVSFDANSLYPSVIVSLNISPETKIGKLMNLTEDSAQIQLPDKKNITITRDKFNKLLDKEKLSISKANIIYTQKFKGVVPNLIDNLYKERVQLKNTGLKYEADIEKYKQDPESMPGFDVKNADMLAKQYGTYQLTIKILLNSIYGIFAQKFSPFFDIDHAASITLTGQSVVKQASIIVDDFLKSKYDASQSATVYNDTDSLYISLEEVCKLADIKVHNDKKKVTKEMHDLVKLIDKQLNKDISIWASTELHSMDPRFVFKREVICDVGVFLQKKRYILNVLDKEGVPQNKFKYVGVEVARSTTPKQVKQLITQVIERAITSENFSDTNKVYRSVYNEFSKMPVESIAFRKNVKEYEKYEKKSSQFTIGKGTPNHVKSAIHYNNLLKQLGIDSIYEPITSGNKIKYFYTAPNKYNIKSIAFVEKYPPEFKDIKVDYETMFTKIVTPPIESVYNAIGWNVPNLTQETTTDLFDLFKI